MNPLQELWKEYKQRETVEDRESLKDIELAIKEEEKKAGYDEYDFDKRWEGRKIGEIVPRNRVEEVVDDVISFRNAVAKRAVEKAKDVYGGNPAGVGQLVNMVQGRMFATTRNANATLNVEQARKNLGEVKAKKIDEATKEWVSRIKLIEVKAQELYPERFNDKASLGQLINLVCGDLYG